MVWENNTGQGKEDCQGRPEENARKHKFQGLTDQVHMSTFPLASSGTGQVNFYVTTFSCL